MSTILDTLHYLSCYLDPLFKLLLAVLIGGIIGLQRQNQSKPAGIKTHILVCISSTLIMITSEYLFNIYPNIDPSRLGAQVISGIGFLCAGTILRDGSSIRGLTTAAGIWAVACIGLTIGTGYYIGAIISTLLILIILIISDKTFSAIIHKTREKTVFTIICNDTLKLIEKIQMLLEENELNILSIKVDNLTRDSFCEISISTDYIDNREKTNIVDQIYKLDNVIKVI